MKFNFKLSMVTVATFSMFAACKNSSSGGFETDSTKTIKLHLKKTFNGCIPEGITMMTVGDSASFKISADSFYLKTFQMKQLPSFIKAGSMLTANVKLVGFETPQQMADDVEKRIKERQEMMEKRKAEEKTDIEKYIAD